MEGSEELQPLSWFHAVKTRDAVAQARDGWTYFEAEARGTGARRMTLMEIRFGDGEWMLRSQMICYRAIGIDPPPATSVEEASAHSLKMTVHQLDSDLGRTALHT